MKNVRLSIDETDKIKNMISFLIQDTERLEKEEVEFKKLMRGLNSTVSRLRTVENKLAYVAA